MELRSDSDSLQLLQDKIQDYQDLFWISVRYGR
nr:hypothetical protein [Fischerella thermalis]